jgi:hypothetical protein
MDNATSVRLLTSEVNCNGIILTLEENLLAIGADIRRETGSDVFKTDPQLNEWMQRVRKLGSDPDDDERANKLEQVRLVRDRLI